MCEAGQRWKGWRFGGALSSVVVGPVLVLHLPCRATLRRPRLKRSEVPLASCAFGFRWVVPGLAFLPARRSRSPFCFLRDRPSRAASCPTPDGDGDARESSSSGTLPAAPSPRSLEWDGRGSYLTSLDRAASCYIESSPITFGDALLPLVVHALRCERLLVSAS